MSSLSDVVRALADQPGVEAVVVASMDGLPIAHEGRGAFDPDAVAAPAAPSSWLLVLVEPDANFGRVLYDLRRHRTALATLL